MVWLLDICDYFYLKVTLLMPGLAVYRFLKGINITFQFFVLIIFYYPRASLVAQMVKNLPEVQEPQEA